MAKSEEYLSRAEFVERFLGQNSESKVIWFDKALREKIEQDLSYPLTGARIRYWEYLGERAWIVERIGRDKPITMGFVISEGKIKHFRVLAFRESRGYEVRYPRFTQQLETLMLTADHKLSKGIDNITGATLSVNAVKKSAQFVLYLDASLSSKE